MANCSVDGWRSRQGAAWFPSNDFKAIGSNPGSSLYIASNPGGNNKYTLCVRIKTPNTSGVKHFSSITVSLSQMYKGNNNAGTLYGSIRTTWSDSGKGDTTSTFRTNAVGNEASLTGYTTSWSTKSMTFTGTFAKNTYYYLFLYSKSNSDMYYTTVANFKPTATAVEVWNTYTVSYDANGGSGAPAAQTKTHGTALTLSTTKPTKANGSNTATGSFVITGNANGGYYGNTSTTTTTITATTSTPQTIKYSFGSWNTAKNGSGTSYSSGGSYTTNSAATLYAQYTSSTTNGTTTYKNNAISGLATPSRANSTVATYTITFNANGGSCDTKTLSSNKTRSYTFKGYAETNNATTALANTTTYTAAKTLYAVWGNTDTTAAITLPTPTRSGYKFNGWATSATATTGSTGEYTPTDSITLYAVWSQDYSTIYYNNNGVCVACCIYYNDNGTAKVCNIFYNDNGKAVQI